MPRVGIQLDSRFLNLNLNLVSKMTVHTISDVSFEVKENEFASLTGLFSSLPAENKLGVGC